jgi:hypothetical protein
VGGDARKARSRRARRRRQSLRRQAALRASPALTALTSSALSLPGLAGSAAADSPNERVRADYSYSFYSEDNLSKSQVVPGATTKRYDIETHQVRLAAPVAERFDVGFDFVYETMSGATPWYLVPDADGNPVQVMTGATIEEQRTDARLSGSYYLDRGRAGLAGGFSLENDYLAGYGSVDGEMHFNEKNTTLAGSAGFSIDTIEPTGGGTEGRVVKEHKQSYSASIGLSQILGRSNAVNSTLSYQLSRGFLSDPYKRVLVGIDIAGELTPTPIPDSRPDMRNQLTWLTRYRHHIESIGGTLHADYQFYIDDWQIMSHTVDVAWYQNLWRWLRLVPSVRYYSQSQAEFYAPWFDSLPSSGHYSADYRLSPYGALAWRTRVETRFDTWGLAWMAAFGYERYTSSADLALGDVKVENPGLVSYNLFSFTLTGRF